MKVGDKVQFSETASLVLCCTHGKASVLTVTGIIAGAVFVRQNWTRSEFIVSESDVRVLDVDDAAFQGLIYQAHIDRIRANRLAAS